MTSPSLPMRRHITSPDFADVDNVFPHFGGQKFLAKREAAWSTRTFTSRSGRSWRASNWTSPIWRWSIPYEYLRRADLAKLTAFFNKRQGMAGEFLYLDQDYHSVDGEQFGLGDGITTVFPLTRSMLGWTESVRALNGSPQIFIDGAVQTSALTVSDYAIVTFGTAPAEGKRLTWSGSYFYRCAFTQDSIEPSQLYRSIWALSKIEFESLK